MREISGLDLKILRISKGKTQIELAEELGISSDYLSKLECERRIGKEMREKIVEYLDKEIVSGSNSLLVKNRHFIESDNSESFERICNY